MLCPKCQFENLADSTKCLACNFPLTPSESSNSVNANVYDGFVPSWMKPIQTNVTAGNTIASTSANSTLSIEDLLQKTLPADKSETDNPPVWQQLKPSPATEAVKPPPTPPFSEPKVPPSPKVETGVYKGCYYFTGEDGETVIMRLAGLMGRFWGAVIDSIITYLLSSLFYLIFFHQ